MQAFIVSKSDGKVIMKEPWNWDEDDLKKLIGQAESIRLEFKQASLFNEQRNSIVQNLTKEVSAFANTEGGTIVIGIAEKKIGKSKVADSLDSGLDRNVWSPEQIQQIIESNISPYLTGLRVKPIKLSASADMFAYAIYVPQGTTAYQAFDRCYYGRSEYECKALPDHEIRLRMFRGQKPSATIKVSIGKTTSLRVSPVNVKTELAKQSPRFAGALELLGTDDRLEVDVFQYRLCVKNTGEINITEFKAKIEPSCSIDMLETFSWDVKDGWSPNRGPFTYSDPSPMRLNIYSDDEYDIFEDKLFVEPGKRLLNERVHLNWTLYLKDTLPIRGIIDLGQALEEYLSNIDS